MDVEVKRGVQEFERTSLQRKMQMQIDTKVVLLDICEI